jgi:hypothetical protein
MSGELIDALFHGFAFALAFWIRLIQAAREGVAIARGELDPARYRVHSPCSNTARRATISGSSPGRLLSTPKLQFWLAPISELMRSLMEQR